MSPARRGDSIPNSHLPLLHPLSAMPMLITSAFLLRFQQGLAAECTQRQTDARLTKFMDDCNNKQQHCMLSELLHCSARQ